MKIGIGAGLILAVLLGIGLPATGFAHTPVDTRCTRLCTAPPTDFPAFCDLPRGRRPTAYEALVIVGAPVAPAASLASFRRTSSPRKAVRACP